MSWVNIAEAGMVLERAAGGASAQLEAALAARPLYATAPLAATFPHHGKPGPAGTRRRLVASFPFKLHDAETDCGILIHAVAGDHQFPEYRLSRVPKNDG